MIIPMVEASAKIRVRQGKIFHLYNKKQDILIFTLHDRSSELLSFTNLFVARGFSAY